MLECLWFRRVRIRPRLSVWSNAASQREQVVPERRGTASRTQAAPLASLHLIATRVTRSVLPNKPCASRSGNGRWWRSGVRPCPAPASWTPAEEEAAAVGSRAPQQSLVLRPRFSPRSFLRSNLHPTVTTAAGRNSFGAGGGSAVIDPHQIDPDVLHQRHRTTTTTSPLRLPPTAVPLPPLLPTMPHLRLPRRHSSWRLLGWNFKLQASGKLSPRSALPAAVLR